MKCEYEPIPLQPTLSIRATKTNTLHQFDPVGVVGLPTPVGKVPFLFYVKDTCDSAHKGILYYDDRDTVCYFFPEDIHAEWCKQPVDMKFDTLEKWEGENEWGYKRKHGILELWIENYRKWYNGRVLFQPKLRVQGCGNHLGGYPTSTEVEILEEKPKTKIKPVRIKKTTLGCGCRKG